MTDSHKSNSLPTQATNAAEVFFVLNPSASPMEIERAAGVLAKHYGYTDSDAHWFWETFTNYITANR